MHYRYFSKFLLCAVVTLLTGAVSTYGSTDLQSQYVKAWYEVQDGFKYRDEGKRSESLKCFQKALATFQKISQQDADWESNLVQARIRDCEQELAVLSGAPEIITAKVVPDTNDLASGDRLPEKMADTAEQAADFFKEKLYEESAAKYQDIINAYPQCAYAWMNLGIVRFQENKYPESRHALAQAYLLNPTDSTTLRNLGIVDVQMGNRHAAITELNKAKALDGTDDPIIQYFLDKAQAK